VTLPRIRSESPAFDLHHPEIAALELESEEELVAHIPGKSTEGDA
jgi:cytochrome c oxidase subunit 1